MIPYLTSVGLKLGGRGWAALEKWIEHASPPNLWVCWPAKIFLKKYK